MASNIPDNDYNYNIKVMMLGDSGVGKLNIRTRFINNEFNELEPTNGTEYECRKVHINEKIIKAQLWDFGCQERYRGIISNCCREAMVALLVYDITSRKTFKNVEQWLKYVREYLDTKKLVIMLVGNKSDLDNCREVSKEEATSFAGKENLLFTETSALDATNVEECFKNVLTKSISIVRYGMDFSTILF